MIQLWLGQRIRFTRVLSAGFRSYRAHGVKRRVHGLREGCRLREAGVVDGERVGVEDVQEFETPTVLGSSGNLFTCEPSRALSGFGIRGRKSEVVVGAVHRESSRDRRLVLLMAMLSV